jgi:hypothetical protein
MIFEATYSNREHGTLYYDVCHIVSVSFVVAKSFLSVNLTQQDVSLQT